MPGIKKRIKEEDEIPHKSGFVYSYTFTEEDLWMISHGHKLGVSYLDLTERTSKIHRLWRSDWSLQKLQIALLRWSDSNSIVSTIPPQGFFIEHLWKSCTLNVATPYTAEPSLKMTASKRASQFIKATRLHVAMKIKHVWVFTYFCVKENNAWFKFILYHVVNKAVIIQHLSIRSVFVIVVRVLLVLNGTLE